jgi:hypothetical protein
MFPPDGIAGKSQECPAAKSFNLKRATALSFSTTRAAGAGPVQSERGGRAAVQLGRATTHEHRPEAVRSRKAPISSARRRSRIRALEPP